MENRIGWRIALGFLLLVLLVAGAAALGWYAYNAGLAQGGAQAGSQLAPSAGTPYAVYPYGPYGFHRFGFGLLGCLGPVLLLFFVFGLFRLLFWGGMGWRHHGPWGWGHRGPWGSEEFRDHFRERAEAWHREMHGEKPEESAKAKV
jgi:hypothetical protein